MSREVLSRLPPAPDRDLRRALDVLGVDVTPGTVAAVASAIALAGLALAVPAALIHQLAGAVAVCTAAAVVALVRAGPRTVLRVRRTRALGDAPALVGRAVLRMRVTPTAEAAAAFAAETGEGPLAEGLARQVRRARSSPGSGLEAFADAWREMFPALARAAMLVEAAGSVPEAERERTLGRATTAVLDGTRERMARFAVDLRGPATGLYAFGVLLPLALVGLLPAARVAGLGVPLSAVVATYDVLLPLGLCAAGGWLLVRRPLAFPPRRVPADHPAVPERRWPRLVAGAVVAAAAWALAPLVLPFWTRPVAAAGFGLGSALAFWYRPVVRVRRHARDVEDGLPDVLYLVGRRVAAGRSVEQAIEHAAGEVDGEAGDAFAAAARRGRLLRVGVREAFLGTHGALADVPSPRIHSTVRLLAVAAREGRPAGRAVVATADHLEELQSVERAARRDLGRVTGTLSHTAAVFGPLVAGATVALADAMGGTLLLDGPAGYGTPALGLALGGYVLVLSAVLAALATGLRRGLDRSLVGYRVGLALASATAVYLVGFAATGLLA